LRLIERVISSPWKGDVGEWRYWCPRCRILTVPAEWLRPDAPDGAIGRVFGIGE
jgi:hypothetical protein